VIDENKTVTVQFVINNDDCYEDIYDVISNELHLVEINCAVDISSSSDDSDIVLIHECLEDVCWGRLIDNDFEGAVEVVLYEDGEQEEHYWRRYFIIKSVNLTAIKDL
jgi:hypothetical protein